MHAPKQYQFEATSEISVDQSNTLSIPKWLSNKKIAFTISETASSGNVVAYSYKNILTYSCVLTEFKIKNRKHMDKLTRFLAALGSKVRSF